MKERIEGKISLRAMVGDMDRMLSTLILGL